MVLSVLKFKCFVFILFDLNLEVLIQLSILKYNLGKSCVKSLRAITLLCENCENYHIQLKMFL